MTYNVFGGTLSLTQSINLYQTEVGKKTLLRFLAAATGCDDFDCTTEEFLPLTSSSEVGTSGVLCLQPATRLLMASQHVYLTERQTPGW